MRVGGGLGARLSVDRARRWGSASGGVGKGASVLGPVGRCPIRRRRVRRWRRPLTAVGLPDEAGGRMLIGSEAEPG